MLTRSYEASPTYARAAAARLAKRSLFGAPMSIDALASTRMWTVTSSSSMKSLMKSRSSRA